ncbi:surface protease GP63, putative [Trypanosoma cruzi marinkellei]|uniref:Leishmanolysin-like peptidase n=1 Tax=Trypanosoma cruzi marinkellei TaxID=85056 RepID=K2N4T4_TRYCR|nr:surface protease GP63, putative [Trypanosoma cruzi marinkellei]
MELQDDDGDGRTLESHWLQRHARDEWKVPIDCAGKCTELTLASLPALGCLMVKWEMAEPMGWCGNSGCGLLYRKCSALKMSEYPQMFCEAGVPAGRCASDRYSSGYFLGSVNEGPAKHTMDSCLIIDPALVVRDAEAVVWSGEYLSAVPGDEPFLWCLDTLPANATDARDPEETYLSAAMHAALRCLGMQVHLRVTEKGNVRCVSCTDGAKITWAIPP